MRKLRARFVYTLVATTLIGAVLPIVTVIAQALPAEALPITATGTDAYYSTSLGYPAGATGFTKETFNTTVASQPTWKSDGGYFYANQVGFSGPTPPVTFDGRSSIYTDTAAPSTSLAPTVVGDLLVAFVTSPTAATLTVSNTASGMSPLSWTKVTLRNNPTSLAVWYARDNYVPATTSVSVSVNAPGGPVAGLTVEAFEYAYDTVGATAENSSAGGGGSGSGAPSVSVNTIGGYPSRVLGVGYDPTSASTITQSGADTLDSHATDPTNHATLWVQSQTAAVTSGASNPVTLSDTVAANDAWQYAAVEIRAQGLGLYVGIMPDYSGGASDALFSYFGSGATSLAASCGYSADGSAGVSCHKPFTFVLGDKFQTQVTAVVSTLTTFTATVKDLTANTAAVTIGSWKLPTGIGVLKKDPGGWTEWLSTGTSCSSLPYSRVINGPPTGVGNDTGKTTVTASFTSTNGPVNKCASAQSLASSSEMSTTGESQVNPDVTGYATSAAPSVAVALAPQAPGDLLVASVSTYTGSTVTISGGGLTWTKAFEQRDNIVNDGGLISVWTARAASTYPAPAVTVTSAITGNIGWAQTLSVTGYVGAAGIGATSFMSGPNTTSPSVSITPQSTGSWVSTAGFDADSPATPTPGAGQTLDAKAMDTVLNSEMWFQHDTTTSGAGQTIPAFTTAGVPITIGDTLSPAGAWDLGAVEILPAPKVNWVSRTPAQTGTGAVTATVLPTNGAAILTDGDLLVAYVSTTNSATVTVSSPSDPGIVWTNALNRADTIPGDGGLISVWQAEVPHDFGRSSVAVQSAITGNNGWAQTLVVEDFNGAAAIGATQFATGAVGTNPLVTITTPQRTGSWIAAVGFDADSPTTVTPPANQVLSRFAQDNVFFTEMWFQYGSAGATASVAVTSNDVLSPSGAWDLGAVEIMPQT